MVLPGDRSEIAFFDVETAVPILPGKGFAILEFGAILVCPRKLVELDGYSTLVRPADLSLISTLSVRSNGITKDAVLSSPTFAEIADRVYDILQGRIWAGHNILRFDCARIREAFTAISRPPPEPKGTIDSLALLTQRFGRRAGDMKMATLATYFGLGRQTHRSLDDVRMNLEILKYCSTVLFLESSLPDIFTENCWVSPNATTRSRSNAKSSLDGMMHINASSSTARNENHQLSSCTNQRTKGNHPILSLMTPNTGEEVHAESSTTRPDAFDMGPLRDEVDGIFHPSDDSDATGEVSGSEYPGSDDTAGEESGSDSPKSSISAGTEGSSAYAEFLELNEVSIPSLSASLVPLYRGTQGVQIMHKDTALQLCCTQLRVRFAISTKFVDYAGRPRLNFVVDATPNLCQVLDACNSLAQRLSVDSGSNSEWRPVVTRKSGFLNSPTVRLHIPTVRDGSIFRWETDIYKRVISTTPERLVFSTFDVAELECLFIPGSFVDAYFSLDPYDYQQNAGIRLVARKLILCCV